MKVSEIYRFRIEENNADRIDRVLSGLMEETSRNSIQRLIQEGKVKVNHQVILSKKHLVKTGDYVELSMDMPVEFQVLPEDIPIDIVYEDKDLLIVNKKKGMVVHPAAGNASGTLVNALLFYCGKNLSTINGEERPGIVHRIDKDTSGLLIVAKNDRTHINLAEQLAEHAIKRVYQAIVHNNFIDDEGKVEGPIGRDPKNRLRMAVVPNGKPAVTHYKVLERFGQYTFIEARLETGRTHQIRVHMAYVNHPLLGDKLYGPKKHGKNFKGQILHAKTLGFYHPTSGEYMELDSQLPDDFQTVLNRLKNRSNLRA